MSSRKRKLASNAPICFKKSRLSESSSDDENAILLPDDHPPNTSYPYSTDEINYQLFEKHNRCRTSSRSSNSPLNTGDSLASSRTSLISDSSNGSSGYANSSTAGEVFSYSSVAQKMMKTMGHVPGRGLGVDQSGIVEPIEASQQRGRRGLGHSVPKVASSASSVRYRPENEHVSVNETVTYIETCPVYDPPQQYELSSWIVIGPRKEDISDETKFCDESILAGILEGKNVFDHLGDKEVLRARSRSNPYETIGKVFFQNRAALKMANLDAITGFSFTNPVLEGTNKSAVLPDEVLFFADVCAAPGGFAEYCIWRRKECKPKPGFADVHGYGFTLRTNDFKLRDFYAAPREFFEPHYGENGLNGDGDIYKPSNITNFCNFVKQSTLGRGVHFMMADGGFSVEGQENIQEILSKQLYLGQFIVALGIIREGGHFVCKLFDVLTPFSVGLIYLMYRCFKKVSLHKPNTSRPANSERYIICQYLKSGCNHVFSHLFEVNEQLCSLNKTNEDITELVPLDIMESDTNFMEYIVNSNNRIGTNQIIGLQKIQVFADNPHNVETRQGQIRTDSLISWQVPDRTRVAPRRHRLPDRAAQLLYDNQIEAYVWNLEELSSPQCLNKIMNLMDYKFVVLSASNTRRRERGFIMGMGVSNVYRSEHLHSNSWERLSYSIELPPDTLVYGEFVEEIRGLEIYPTDRKRDLKNQRRVTALHIIDACLLNGYDVTKYPTTERLDMIRKFCLAVNKPSRPDLLPVRCKELFRLTDIEEVLSKPKFSVREIKGHGFIRVMHCDERMEAPSYHIPAHGLMLVRIVKEPWIMAFSNTNKRKYFFNTLTRKAMFEAPPDSVIDFSNTFRSAIIWPWASGTLVTEDDEDLDGLDEEDILRKRSLGLHLSHFTDRIRNGSFK